MALIVENSINYLFNGFSKAGICPFAWLFVVL